MIEIEILTLFLLTSYNSGYLRVNVSCPPPWWQSFIISGRVLMVIRWREMVMSSRCWQEWDGLDSDLTTPRQIIILASNSPLQTRVLYPGNHTTKFNFILFKEKRISSFPFLCIARLKLHLNKAGFRYQYSFMFSHFPPHIISPPLPLALVTGHDSPCLLIPGLWLVS